MDVKAIVGKYEKCYKGKKYLFYPGSGKYMLISFTSAVKGERYEMLSWYVRPAEPVEGATGSGDTAQTQPLSTCAMADNLGDPAVLYLTENDPGPEFNWYLKDEAIFQELIAKIMEENGLTNKQVITIGGSMGGTAALNYGLKNNVLGIISYRPQIDFETSKTEFKNRHLEKEWIQSYELVTKLVAESHQSKSQIPQLPMIYLNYNNYAPDYASYKKFIDHVDKESIYLMIHNCGGTTHRAYGFTQPLCDSIIRHFLTLTDVTMYVRARN